MSATPQLFGGGFGDDNDGWGSSVVASDTAQATSGTNGDEEEGEDGDGESSSSGDPSSASEFEGEDGISEVASALQSVSLGNPTAPQTAAIPPSASTPSVTSAVLAPSHPPLYLDTVFEYITPEADRSSELKSKAKAVAKAQQRQADEELDTLLENGSGGAKWGAEGYEKMEGIDEVFERFVTRVENEPLQVVRCVISQPHLTSSLMPERGRDTIQSFPI